MSHPSLTLTLGLLALASMIVNLVLFVVFGEVTVRRLRKLPDGPGRLGIEFISGGDIINASLALSRSSWLTRRLEASPAAGWVADTRWLREHTTRLDRALARAHFYTLWLTVTLACMWYAADRWA